MVYSSKTVLNVQKAACQVLQSSPASPHVDITLDKAETGSSIRFPSLDSYPRDPPGELFGRLQWRNLCRYFKQVHSPRWNLQERASSRSRLYPPRTSERKVQVQKRAHILVHCRTEVWNQMESNGCQVGTQSGATPHRRRHTSNPRAMGSHWAVLVFSEWVWTWRKPCWRWMAKPYQRRRTSGVVNMPRSLPYVWFFRKDHGIWWFAECCIRICSRTLGGELALQCVHTFSSWTICAGCYHLGSGYN